MINKNINTFEKQKQLEKILKENPQDNSAKFELAKLFFTIKKIDKSKLIIDKLLLLKPKDVNYLKFGAVINKFLEEYDLGIQKYKTIIKINPNDVFAYINIAELYNFKKNYDEIIYYSKMGLKIDDKNTIIINNLIVGLIYKKLFKEAYKYSKKLDKIKDSFQKSASTGIYLKEQLNDNYKFKFINDPINYIAEYNFNNNKNNNFLSDIVEFIEKKPNYTWEPREKSTRKGFQTKSNLFSKYKNEIIIKTITKIIKLSLKKYFIEYKNSNDDFITKFPESIYLKGWSVILKSSGFQSSHNHPAGWISGVIYLKIPNKLKDDEGKIEFSYHGYDMPIINKNISKKMIDPKEGKIVLFPSTLFHRTIPFKSDNERISLAFDIIPK